MLSTNIYLLLILLFIFVQIYNSEQRDSNLNVISRYEWNAKPSAAVLPEISGKFAEKVIIAHTVSGWCYNMAECKKNVRNIQQYHMHWNKFLDIGYNFLIGGDGNVYEGRGWNKKGAHTKNHNDNSVGIAFIGDFMNMRPTTEQLDAAQKLIEYGVEIEKISPTYKLYGHRQLTNTLSPGDVLYDLIKNWKHWSQKLY